ncbi:MAG: hypothetical protein E7672_01185 [Ruminococcaceae bacterium]|nr:hypothetical protein [Oscillospiraceae bacterium]
MRNIENECGIVEDLLPLYTEELAGEESVRFVEAHLKECVSCRAEFERMKKQIAQDEKCRTIDTVPLDKMGKMIKKNRNRSVLLSVLIVTAVFLSLFSNITSPRYFDYSDGVVSASVTDEGNVYLWFSDEVTYWSVDKVKNDEGRDFYTVTASYSLYDRLLGRSKNSNLHPSLYPTDAVIRSDDGEVPVVYYVQNNGEDDVCLCGDHSDIGMGRTLPRLVLGYYLLAATGVLIFLLGLCALLHKNKSALSSLVNLALIPASYIAAHLAVKGFVSVTYSALHDFIYIVITAAVIYAAAVVMLGIIREKR